MGSFNETCALSSLNIGYGDRIRLVLLTQNPYVVTDSHDARRGVYHHDNWFPRTPPIAATYDDYGRAEFADSPLTQLVADVLSDDVVERPLGFNYIHDVPVCKNQPIDHYLEAAWQGRLLVRQRDARDEPAPAGWPTWQSVRDKFKAAKLKLQVKDASTGYNAQPVAPGVVCVTFAKYGDHAKNLEVARKLLEADYDCRTVKMFDDRDDDQCLLVTAKGALKNPGILGRPRARKALSTHPKLIRETKQLPVLAVMIREDVWNAFINLKLEADWGDSRPLSRDDLRKRIADSYETAVRAKDRWRAIDKATAPAADILKLIDEHPPGLYLSDMAFRNSLHSIPFQTTAATHLAHAAQNDFKDKDALKDALIDACADLARVEMVMARLHRPWHIPPIGGQDGEWAAHARLLGQLAKIARGG